MSDGEEQAKKLTAAIAGLEAQRAALGDAVVEPALTALRDQLSELNASPRVGAAGDERKIVTVVFADITGFTALAEKLDAEEVRTLINACFECLVPIVQKYAGTIDKFIGDEIMALFGAPVAHEDDPERALRASLEMPSKCLIAHAALTWECISASTPVRWWPAASERTAGEITLSWATL